MLAVMVLATRHARITTTSVTTPVMWSETVGLRTRPVSDQKIGLGLGCVVRHGLVMFVVQMILKDNFLSTILVSLFCAWNITTVVINRGIYLLKS